MSGPDLADLRDQNQSFEQVAGLLPNFTWTMTGEGEPQMLRCTAVSPEFFSLLGIHPILGRAYRPEEYHIDGETVIISYNFWWRQFGADPHIIGRVLRLSDSAMTVIGVMPALPDIYPQTDIWAKLIPDFQFMKARGNKFLVVYAKLKPSVSVTQGEQDLTAILHRAPETPADTLVFLVSLRDELTGKVRPILNVLMAAVGFVLLIVCVNVATLLSARNEERRREVAIRRSLGAGLVRLSRQWFTEHLILALFGGVLGMLLAQRGVRLLVWLGSNQLPRAEHVGINLPVLGFALLMSLLTSVIFGISPALALARSDVDPSLRSGRGDIGTVRRPRRNILIVSEVGLSVVLLIEAGLLVRGLWTLLHVDLGFMPDHLLTAYLRLPDDPSDSTTGSLRQRNFYRALLTEVPELRGVAATAVADCMPGLRAATANLIFEDRPRDAKDVPSAAGCWISAGYFRASGTPLLRGRTFNERDIADAPAVVIVNDALARRYWPNQNPIGKRMVVSYLGPGRRSDVQLRVREVVGVVGNVKQHGLDAGTGATVYMPFYQDETGHVFSAMVLLVRCTKSPANVAGNVRAKIRQFEPNIPLTMRLMDDVLLQSLGPRRFTFVVLGVFAATALLLAGIGIYGVVTYSVSRRTREIGIRMALGAARVRVLAMILKEVLVPVSEGLALGTVTAITWCEFAAGTIYVNELPDPLVVIIAIALMLCVAVVATWLPAYRAASVTPLEALRMQ
jgi:putative ABC transport system permease protein